MLLLIGAVGLLFAIQRYRLPGVPFFSFITVFNRKKKLTEIGGKVYLVFFVVLVLGLFVNFESCGRSNVPADKQSAVDTDSVPKGPYAEVPAGPSAAVNERPSAADTESLAPADPDASGRYREILDHLFVTYILANNSDAQGFRDTCNEAVATSLLESTVGQSTDKEWNALKQCTRFAKSLCSSQKLDPCPEFDLQSGAFQSGRY